MRPSRLGSRGRGRSWSVEVSRVSEAMNLLRSSEQYCDKTFLRDCRSAPLLLTFRAVPFFLSADSDGTPFLEKNKIKTKGSLSFPNVQFTCEQRDSGGFYRCVLYRGRSGREGGRAPCRSASCQASTGRREPTAVRPSPTCQCCRTDLVQFVFIVWVCFGFVFVFVLELYSVEKEIKCKCQVFI